MNSIQQKDIITFYDDILPVECARPTVRIYNAAKLQHAKFSERIFNSMMPEQSTSEKPIDDESEQRDSSSTNPPGFLSILQSVVAAMFGVQSDKKRQQDFESGHPGSYIFVGVIMVIVFVLTLVAIVNSIVENSGQ